MNFVEPSVTRILEHDLQKKVEMAYRICYKSEGKMTDTSAMEFLPRLIYTDKQNKHWSPLEHARIDIILPTSWERLIRIWKDKKTHFLTFGYDKTKSWKFRVVANFRTWLELITDPDFSFDPKKRSAYAENPMHDPDMSDGFGNYANIPTLGEAMIVLQNVLAEKYPAVFKPAGRPSLFPEPELEIMEDENYMTYHIVTTRDILQELARHRSMSFSVESTRYCNYSKRGMTFTVPRPYNWTEFYDWENQKWNTWTGENFAEVQKNGGYFLTEYLEECKHAETIYNQVISNGAKPQMARMLLPGALKTELFMTGSVENWLAFLALRLDAAAHPQIRILAEAIWADLKKNDFIQQN